MLGRQLALAKFRAKKQFGQNFLVNKGVIKKIIEIVNPTEKKKILEIGAGKGALTEMLVQANADIYAVEIDRDLLTVLRQKFEGSTNFHLFNKNFLELDLSRIFANDRFVVVGNIPYNITTPIITKLIEHRKNIDFAVLMVQWEVAKRLVATNKDGKDYGSLSLAIQYYTHSKICFKVKRGSFYPIPKVDSAVVKLNFSAIPVVSIADEKLLFDVIHQAFQFRRKKLANCLRRPPFNLSSIQIDRLCKATGIDLNRRGEELSLEEFATLANFLIER